ncbi:hypothetical protein [Sorangium sp. So ce1097]|uniref:hypothetical protein n=1 Tax=Sorangium sp. So ce1097 TaxID=3133330 RepID=UPI003F63A977
MSNRFSSRASLPRRAANLLLLASLAAPSPLLGGCGLELQIGDGSSQGGGPDTATGAGGSLPGTTAATGTGGSPPGTTATGTGGSPPGSGAAGGGGDTTATGTGGTEEIPPDACPVVESGEEREPTSAERCQEIGAELKAAHDTALQGAELAVAPLAGTWVVGSGPERVELVIAANGQGTLLFGEPTDLPPSSDPDEPYLTNRGENDPEDIFGLAHLKIYPGFRYSVVAETGRGAEMSFHIWIMEVWEGWCAAQTPVFSPYSRHCHACMYDEGRYAFITSRSACEVPPGCYAGHSLEEETLVDCGRVELCALPNYNVCNCSADACFANLGGSQSQLTVYPYTVTLDPADATILRLKSLSELDDKRTYYLDKQP